MRKLVWLFILLLVGCEAESKEALQVQLSASEQKVEVWAPITFQIEVESFGEQEDNAIVEMEIINEQQQTVGILPATFIEAGRYELETVLDLPGQYEVISHVTVEEHHSMPSLSITVVE